MEIAEEASEAASGVENDETNATQRESPEPMSNSSDESNEARNEVSEMLAKGLLNLYEPPLVKVKANLNDLVRKQESVLNEMAKQKERINEANDNKEIKDMMQKLIVYKDKIRRIRSDMLYITKRTQELKKKAIEVQEFKVEEKARKVQKIHYEQTLIGGGGSSSSKK